MKNRYTTLPWLMLVPIGFVLIQLPYIHGIPEIISSTAYLVLHLLFALLMIRLFRSMGDKGKQPAWALILIVFGTALDQGIKLLLHYYKVSFTILGEYVAIRERKNLHQMGILNFMDVTLEDSLILITRICLVLLAAVVYCIIRKKNADAAFGLILFVTGGFASVLDSACWGYTLDYVYFKGLVTYDLKDFIVDAGNGFLLKAWLEPDLERLLKKIKEN